MVYPKTVLTAKGKVPERLNGQVSKTLGVPKAHASSNLALSAEEVGALMEGVIAVTPWRKNMFFDEVYNLIDQKDIQL